MVLITKVRYGTDKHDLQGYVDPAMAKKKADRSLSPNILDYPSSMSQYERESLAAEAKLAADRKIRKLPRPVPKAK
jgi:hypothetical protein